MSDRRVAKDSGDEIELVQLITDVWAQRWLVAAFVLISLIASIFYLQQAAYLYTAEMKVTPTQPSSQSSRSKLGGLAGLASIAGVSLGQDSGAMSFMLYTKGVSSRSVAEALARRPDLMQVVFSNEWDQRTQRFVEPQPSPLAAVAKSVKSLLGLPTTRWQKPDAARLHDYIEANVKIEEAPDAPLATLTYSHEDPRFATRFLAAIHQVLDDNIRRRAFDRASQYIDYLSSQLETARLLEHRNAIAQALSEQERNRMMASSRMAFAAEPFDPPTASLRPTSPRPILVLAVGTIIGFVIGIGVALLRAQIRRYRSLA